MLKEIIVFIDTYDKNKPEQKFEKDYAGKKIIIVKTKEKNNFLEYDELEILDDDSKIKEWIDKNKYYEKIIKNFDGYILPSMLQKALGSMSGLATYSFFAFKLSDKNLNCFLKKISQTKFSKNEHETLIKNIHKILKDAADDLKEKNDNTFKYLNFYVLIHTGEERFVQWEKIASDSINKKTAQGKASLVIDGECFVCNKNTTISNPNFLTNYDEKKIFLKHVTKFSKNGKGIPLRACRDCVLKLDKFDKILKHYKIKIFPLFIVPDELNAEIKLLGSNLEKDENKFDFIFKQLKQDKKIFDFYLVVITHDDYYFFDYVTGYKWEIGEYVDFFDEDRQSYSVTRIQIESEISKALTDKPHIQYFGKIISAKDQQQTTLTYSLRQKVFDFVYRNQRTLTDRDLQNIILFRVEKSIRNNTTFYYRETFNLFFNRHLLLQNKDKTNCVLDHIKDAKEKITSNEIEKFEIASHEAWAYFTGQIAYYLVSLSKSKDKTYGLLEPFTNKSTTQLVKKTIEQLIEQYRHEINLSNMRFRKIASCVLSYETDSSFIPLKIPFYVGAFDENII